MTGTIRASLERIINLVDYTGNQCSVTAPLAAALPEDVIVEARAALKSDTTHIIHRVALLVLLDMVDFTSGAATPFEMVGGCLPKEVILAVRKALETP